MPKTNEELVQGLIRDGYLKTPLLIGAFRKVDRKDFVPKKLLSEAYGNYPLPIGEGQTISQPLTVAFMLELLNPRPGEKILDVGSGSGWTTALLAYCVSRKIFHDQFSTSKQKLVLNPESEIINSKRGHVVAAELVPNLCKFGESNVRKYDFIEKGIVKFFCGDVSRLSTLPKAGGVEEFDKILAGAAAAEEVPAGWKKMLKIGGRIVAPAGNSIIVLDKVSESKFRSREYFGFSFVPLIEEN